MVRLSSVLITLAWWGYRRARLTLVGLALAALATVLLLHARSWEAPLYTLLPSGDPERQRLEELTREVGPAQDLVVLVTGQDARQRTAYLDRLGQRLKADPERYSLVLAGLDLSFLRPSVLYHLRPAELQALETAARSLRPLLEAGSAQALLDRAQGPALDARRSEVLLKLSLHYLDQLQAALDQRGRAAFVSPVWSFVDRSRLDPMAVRLWEGRPVTWYITLDGGQTHALALRAGPRGKAEALRGLRQQARLTAQHFPGIRAQITGVGAVVSEQQAGMLADLSRAGLIALLVACLVFGLIYRDFYRPLAAGAASLVGSWLLFALLAPAGLPAGLGLFLGAAAGLCFALRLGCCYTEQRRKGDLPLNSWRTAMLGPGKGFVGGTLTLGSAFLALLLVGFPGAAQIGAGGALALAGALLGTLALLPGLIGLHDPHPTTFPALTDQRLRRLERRVRGRYAAAAAAVLLTVGALSRGSTALDFDPSRLVDPTLPATAAELGLEQRGHASLNLLALVRDPEEARALEERLRALPEVGRVESALSLLPADCQRKEPILRRIHQAVAGLSLPPSRSELEADQLLELAPVVTRFESLVARMGLASPRATHLARQIQLRLAALRHELPDLGPGPLEDGLVSFERGCTDDLRSLIGLLGCQSLTAPGPALLPPEVRARSVSASGQLVLKIYPRATGFSPDQAARFASSVQTVAPRATGAAVLLAHLADRAEQTYARAGVVVWLIVLMVVILRLGSLRRALHVMLAPTLAWFWTAGFLALCHQPLTLASFLLPPVMLGLGASLAVEEQRRRRVRGGRPMLMALLAVTVGALGLGTAHNPGLAGLGLVLSVGLVSNWLAVSCLPRARAARTVVESEPLPVQASPALGNCA